MPRRTVDDVTGPVADLGSASILRPAVITYDAARFDDVCAVLAQKVQENGPVDLVVGIATGGDYVAAALAVHMPPATVVGSVKIQRPGTVVKRKLRIWRLLRYLPKSVTAQLRWLEVEWREAAYRVRRSGPSERNPRPMSADLPTLDRFRHVLIVDDTVDSGDTLAHACSVVRGRYPNASITTAVIASTWRRPGFVPDICLYPRTLVRFPWSMDA